MLAEVAIDRPDKFVDVVCRQGRSFVVRRKAFVVPFATIAPTRIRVGDQMNKEVQRHCRSKCDNDDAASTNAIGSAFCNIVIDVDPHSTRIVVAALSVARGQKFPFDVDDKINGMPNGNHLVNFFSGVCLGNKRHVRASSCSDKALPRAIHKTLLVLNRRGMRVGKCS